MWFVFVVILVIALRKVLRQILSELAWRLRSGATIKIASVELGSIAVVAGAEVSKNEKERGVHADEGRRREHERRTYRNNSRDVMLVHRLYRSREDGQLYDLIVNVVPHKDASLSCVSKVEYFLGSYWGNKVFPSIDRSRGFEIATAAYGPVLCTAEVFFNDGTSVVLHRYLDFEMGASAPGRLTG